VSFLVRTAALLELCVLNYCTGTVLCCADDVFSMAGEFSLGISLFMKIVSETRSDVNSACHCECNRPH
jgi:hypothetical protein